MVEVLGDGVHAYPRHDMVHHGEVHEAASIGHVVASFVKADLGVVVG